MVNGLKNICKGDEKNTQLNSRGGENTHSTQQPYQKESRRNCGNSPAARRVPKNADSICEQFNRETSGTQEKSFSLNSYVKESL